MITDFGLSKMEQNGIMSTACGTPGYVGKQQNRDYLLLGLYITIRTKTSFQQGFLNVVIINRILNDPPPQFCFI